jgi:cob(I)alamin adenosyltransferase
LPEDFAVGHRLTKIYTRTGDSGETGLGDGTRMPKDAARIEALGAVDELNSQLGLLLTETLPEDLRVHLGRVQHALFDLGGELSIPGYALITADQVQHLEECLDHYNAQLPPLKDFILPGGSRAAALTHVVRTVCRRAERTLVRLGHESELPPMSLKYLNRLSDLFFVLARALNRTAQIPDVLWQRTKPSS